MDVIHPGNVWAAFSSWAVQTLPLNGVRWPKLGPFGPVCVLQSKPETWTYLRLARPDRDSEGTFFLCQPPLLVVYPHHLVVRLV